MPAHSGSSSQLVPEGKDKMLLRSVGNYLPADTACHFQNT